jgi:hypothetical protein
VLFRLLIRDGILVWDLGLLWVGGMRSSLVRPSLVSLGCDLLRIWR